MKLDIISRKQHFDIGVYSLEFADAISSCPYQAASQGTFF